MNQNTKRLVILNLPYILMGLYATNLGWAWRMAAGADMTEKMQSLMTVLPDALGRIIPSVHPLDLLVGLCCGAGLRLAVYLKGKNAKKYRHGSEYGSARWGSHTDIEPYTDPVFQNNVILTKTECLTMNSRPKDPKTARNKNVLIVGSGGDRVQWTKQGAAAGAALRFLQAPAHGAPQKSAKRKREPIRRAILGWDREKERHTKKSQQRKEVKTVARTEDIKITALYERLSRDDEQVGESNSIQNQKMYLEEYARHHGLRNIRHFWDDGYTGTNFNRPGFNALLSEIEAGHVATLVVKDLSRFGRNYLQVGYYTEVVFPKKGVRFIAINNSVDSAKPSDNDFTPFLNIMNEWYAKDTSNKIKAVFKARMKKGMRCSGSIPYGYKRTKEDKQQLLVDEPAAEVVRKIYRLACQGLGTTTIAEQLSAEKVLIPSAYAAKYLPENCRHNKMADPYRWTATTVGYILDRQEYLGHTVLGKSICENFKTKQRRAATADELMIFPNTHEAIVDQDTWDIAHKLRVRKRPKAANGTYTHRLSGLIYCADCGARMGFCGSENEKHYDSSSAFQCGNYRSTTNQCASHFVRASVLETVILKAIQAVSRYALENEAEFVADLQSVWDENKAKSEDTGQHELEEARKRVAELDAMIQNLYESSMKGVLPERQAQRMIQQYDEEQILLERRMEELENQIRQESVKKADTERFLALVKKYRDCHELTDAMLYSFIDRVEVHEATGGRTIYRKQNIDIYFNFIGSYYPPCETVSEEARIAAIDAEQLRKKQEKGKRASERQQQKLKALREAAKAGNPEAVAKYEEHLRKQRERNHRYRQQVQQARAADP